jgi:hypothetical protein
LHPIWVLVCLQLFGQLVNLRLHLPFAISQTSLHSIEFSERCLYHQNLFLNRYQHNGRSGGQLTGRKQLVQKADGVELSSDTVKRAYIVAVLNIEDTLKREYDFERKFLTRRVLL